MTIDETLVLLEELNVKIIQIMSENEQLEAEVECKKEKLKMIKQANEKYRPERIDTDRTNS